MVIKKFAQLFFLCQLIYTPEVLTFYKNKNPQKTNNKTSEN